jgi:DNA-binding CsgD family transcriptional regulator
MKTKLFILFLWCSAISFAQREIYYFKDATGNLNLQQVQKKEFVLLEEQIQEQHSDDVYWFKIPAHPTDTQYIARIEYDRITNVHAFQSGKELERMPKERFWSYKFSRNEDVYISVNPRLHSYIPLKLNEASKATLRDRIQMLINGFYYGFAFVILIYSVSYYFVFQDDAFLWYACLLTSVSFGLFIMDGMLNFFQLNEDINEFLMTLNYLFLAFFSGKFANSYLFLSVHYPNHKKLTYTLGSLGMVFGILYLFTMNYYFLLLVNVIVFTILTTYWIYAVLLFKKNIYIKILVFAYVLILFSAIDFFILKFLGIGFGNVDSMTLKIGCFIEMTLLSVAVLYRMRILRAENGRMKNEILKFSKELETRDTLNDRLSLLSSREREIFQLIAMVKTNKEIANELNVSINTVKFHIKNIYEKLDVHSRKEVLKIVEESIESVV